MAAGDADAFVAALKADTNNGFSSIANMAEEYAKVFAFLRGYRNCVQGNTFDSSWSDEREMGYRAAQAAGLFDVWP